jgi:broad specificity phosphatase PhoE
MLEALQGVSHDHIIRLLGSYVQGEDYHFLFPLANCDLMRLMTEGPDLRGSNGVHRQTEETTEHLNRHNQKRETLSPSVLG